MTSQAGLTPEMVKAAHGHIVNDIHLTPILTSKTLSSIASSAQSKDCLNGTPWQGNDPSHPSIELFFKAENFQKVGAFKARGAFHSLSQLSEAQLQRGVVTNSSGNHAQALALAAKSYGIPAYIVMPRISVPSKIEPTKGYGAKVIFSGSTSQERKEVMNKVMEETGATFVPPYDHPNTILGQGTMGLEAIRQVTEMMNNQDKSRKPLDAIIAPCGGGGMLSGIAVSAVGTGIKVFGAEPSFQGANDAEMGLRQGTRIEKVSTLTIADGLRTPLGEHTWKIISDPTKVQGVFSVSEGNIKAAMKLLFERMKLVIEPSGAVALAVVLFNEDFRRMVQREAGENGWRICVILSGGNTSIADLTKLFSDTA